MNIRKAIQAQAFSFIVPNLVEKALLIMLEYTLYYIKSALRNKTDNFQNVFTGI